MKTIIERPDEFGKWVCVYHNFKHFSQEGVHRLYESYEAEFDGHKEDEWMTLCDWIDERVDYLFPGFEYGYSLSEEKTKKLMAEYNQEYNTLLEELRDLSTALCRITKE
jgi:hypothetical protein